MGLCRDQSTTYLRSLGYNVVRHPREGIAPPGLVGRQGGTTLWLGELSGLVVEGEREAPAPHRDLPAADVNGRRSSRLGIGVGARLLGPIVAAMGGANIGGEVDYTNARTLSFTFSEVSADRVEPLEVDHYLTGAEINAAGPLLSEYVLGNGSLFVVTETIKARRFEVVYETREGVGARVDVPALQGLVGASVEVSAVSERAGTVAYAGARPLVFGFRCLELGVLDGELRLTTVDAGAVPLALAPDAEQRHALLTGEGEGLLELEATAAATPAA
jgi:hypothetical protein